MDDIEVLKSNCAEYAQNSKSLDVLRNANGKNHYKKIAKIVGVHETIASSLLKKALKLGLATKNKDGFYKKTSGVMGYMPKKNKKTNTKTVANIVQKITNNKVSTKISAISTTLSIPNTLLASIGKMTSAYGDLYSVENTLRELIRKVLSPKTDWWKNNVPGGIQTDVQEVIKKVPYHAAKRIDQLEYTHLGQLKEIIINKKNWNDFLVHLNEKDKNAFAATIDKAIPSRNAIGHCIQLKQDDLKFVKMRFVDILKMII